MNRERVWKVYVLIYDNDIGLNFSVIVKSSINAKQYNGYLKRAETASREPPPSLCYIVLFAFLKQAIIRKCARACKDLACIRNTRISKDLACAGTLGERAEVLSSRLRRTWRARGFSICKDPARMREPSRV